MRAIDIVLAPLGIPVCHPPYMGALPQYIVFTLINNAYSDWASGAAIEEETVYSVDLFTKSAYESLAKQVKTLLRVDGYVVSEGPETFEEDTKYHHVNFDVRGWDGVGWQT
ncbi:MAG: hypothetical protein IJI40_09435 [Firmicutes bacterium]|nr:hypothetical protein [Bacillota bacterium]